MMRQIREVDRRLCQPEEELTGRHPVLRCHPDDALPDQKSRLVPFDRQPVSFVNCYFLKYELLLVEHYNIDDHWPIDLISCSRSVQWFRRNTSPSKGDLHILSFDLLFWQVCCFHDELNHKYNTAVLPWLCVKLFQLDFYFFFQYTTTCNLFKPKCQVWNSKSGVTRFKLKTQSNKIVLSSF